MTDQDLTVFETRYWKVILRADDQSYLGRAVVVCKRHVGSLPEVSDDEWHDLKDVMAKYEAACRQAFDATMFNWSCLMNDAYQAENPEPQVHWHVRPRYNHDVTFGGEIFSDKEFGHHYARQTRRVVSDARAKNIVAALQR